MSETGYIASNGLDLVYVFKNKTSGSNNSTYYNIPGSIDLSNIFQPYDGYSIKAQPTGFTVNGNDLCNIFQNINALYTITSGPLPTEINYNTYTGLVFNYSSTYPSQTLTTIVFNYPINIGILMVGGGSSGGSGYSIGPDPGAGGGGGGVVNINSYLITVGTTYYISPGYGALATANSAPNAGGSSLFYTVTSGPNYIYEATGGTNSTGSFNPGLGGDGYYNNQLIPNTNGGSGGLSYGGNQQSGGNSNIPTVILPINQTYILGGGGGSGNKANTAGGACGNGTGGIFGGSGSQTGQSAPPLSSPNSYGGGGGGGTYSSISYLGGNGGNGVVVLWFNSTYTVTGNPITQIISGYTYITFITNGSITFNTSKTFNYMIVGGGGSSGFISGGGGGGGISMGSYTGSGQYLATIGTGGASSTNVNGNDGSQSSLINSSISFSEISTGGKGSSSDGAPGVGGTGTLNGGNGGTWGGATTGIPGGNGGSIANITLTPSNGITYSVGNGGGGVGAFGGGGSSSPQKGGDGGGTLVAEGTPQKVSENEASYTGHYLKRFFQ